MTDLPIVSGILGPAASGFLLGATLIMAIGAQNAFILRQGLMRSHVFILCLICGASDAFLIGAGVAGMGGFVASRPGLIGAVTIGGAAFLFTYAAFALRRALRPSAMDTQKPGGEPMPLKAAIATCLAFTFLNPHVYLDTVVLLGSLSGRYEGNARLAFGLGAMTASFVWFFSLGYGARLLAPLFARPSAWRVLDLIIAAVMIALGTGLLLGMGH